MTSLRLLQHRAADGTRSVIAATDKGASVVLGVDSVRELA
ncbi:MAG: FAH family protein, partial [Sphingomonas sp.]